MRIAIALLAMGSLVLCAGCQRADQTTESASRPQAPSQALPETGGVHQFSAERIEGGKVGLAGYKGKVLLIVNVASRCGNTPQYAGLQKLYEDNRGAGLVVLGFPANDFGSQEPGSNEEIQAFCERKYAVTFPMFAKIHVKGDDKHPLYAWLTDKQIHPDTGGEIEWNFAKFLIGPDGKVIARFKPRTQPSDPKVMEAIRSALAAR